MKLTDYVHIDLLTSEVDVPCEVTPGHLSKRYVRFMFEKISVKDHVPVTTRTELRVCPQCFAQYAYDVAQIGRECSVV